MKPLRLLDGVRTERGRGRPRRLRSNAWRTSWVGLSLWLGCSAVWAQRDPRIGYVFPSGVARGEQLELTVGGQYLDGVTNVVFSGEGIQATVLAHTKPLTQREINALREQLQKLLNEKPAEQDLQAIAELRRKLARPKQPPSPQLAERVRLRVTVRADAAPGHRELRLGVAAGLSNPLSFRVSDLSESVETEPNDRGPHGERALELPVVINGQILPGDTDRFRFRGRAGQRVVVRVEARALIPYLADAVPGWFQATLALYDDAGHELAYADDSGFEPDPLLTIELPRDGEYEVGIRDAIYRGREDFVYRITMGELPWVSTVFPLGGRSGSVTAVHLRGWNLQGRELRVKLPERDPGFIPLPLDAGMAVLNSRRFAVDTLAEMMEAEPNDRPESAQVVPVGSVVNGRIDDAGDRDTFRIEGRAGQVLVAEVLARRLNSPLDSLLRVTDVAGVELALNDDTEDSGFGLLTHHADSRVEVTLPSDGAFIVQLADAQDHGSVAHAYRLRLSEPRPGFELRLFPSALNVPLGGTVPLTIVALRRDGFGGEISLSLKGAPKGFALSGGWVPAGQDRIRCTLTAPWTRTDRPLKLQLQGHAVINGEVVTRRVIPAEDVMQAFIYRHLVPSEGWFITLTSGRGGRAPPLSAVRGRPVELPAGGRATIPLQAENPRRALPAGLELELSEAPPGVAIREFTQSDRGWAMEVEIDGNQVKPGLKGNLIVGAFIEPNRGGSARQPARGRARKTSLGVLPAIPFEVVEP